MRRRCSGGWGMAEAFDLEAHKQAMRDAGWWEDKTADDHLEAAIAAHPERKAVVAYRKDARYETPVKVMTYAELGEAVAQAAGSFRAMGIGPGDVVGVMLPNWWEFVVAVLALGRVGAVPNPLMHIFREHELRFMLGFAEAKAILIPKHFRNFDYGPMLDKLQAELPALKYVIEVDGEERSFDNLVMKSGAAPVSAAEGTPVDPGEMAVLMYTSGTTGEPKGVMHCFNTLFACTKSLSTRFGLGDAEVVFGCTPFGHMTGYAAVMFQALYLGSTIVMMDVWEPEDAIAIMRREGATHMPGATPFLADMCRVILEGGKAPNLRTYLCGGAQIPPVVIENARKLLGLGASSLWGMTEGLSGSLTEPEKADTHSATTDGRAVDGVELLVADENLNPMPTGETGRLYFRGAQQFLGYYKKPGLDGRGPEGWFDTGDLAYMNDEGYIRIDERSKDIIIRGGENVPVVEIETVIYSHPRVVDAAIVGYPDVRLGEKGCAFLTLNDGGTFDMKELCAWMQEKGVAKQYWPEAVEVIETMPRTASGKIQKFVLKDLAKKHSNITTDA